MKMITYEDNYTSIRISDTAHLADLDEAMDAFDKKQIKKWKPDKPLIKMSLGTYIGYLCLLDSLGYENCVSDDKEMSPTLYNKIPIEIDTSIDYFKVVPQKEVE